MALFLCAKSILSSIGCCVKTKVRGLMTKQLFHYEFGEPLHVVKLRESRVPALGDRDVLVRMLAAPVNPTDLNTIQGRNYALPKLPTIPGDEGVGDVIEVGKLVSVVELGQRVVLSSRLLGTWRYYGVYNERHLHVISPNLCLGEASTLSIAPCTAYRLLKDFVKLHPGQTVVQNAANTPVGQSVIQLCKAWDVKTVNIVSSQCGYESMKQHLLNLGASIVCTLEEAEALSEFNTSVLRPVLALNCAGGRHEDVLLKMLRCHGVIVYYGCAYDLPQCKSRIAAPHIHFRKFHLSDWDLTATRIDKDLMYKPIIELMVTGKFRAPVYEPIYLTNYTFALKNTVRCEAFCNKLYVFDFSTP